VFMRSLLFIAAIVTSLATQAIAQDKSIAVASTMSTQDSGLFGYLLPIFKEKTGIDVKIVAQGTGCRWIAMAWSGAPKTSPRSSTEFEMSGVSECLFRGRKLSVCSWYVLVRISDVDRLEF
jgi:hypothetical protein